MIKLWLKQYRCMHHDRLTGESWIMARLVDLGRLNLLHCVKCGKGF